MSKKTKLWLSVASFLMFIGLIIICVVMFINGWDFTKLSTVNYETITYEINDDFLNISIDTDVAELKIIQSEDDKCSVVCHKIEKVKYDVLVVNGHLSIKSTDERKWYDYINIFSDDLEVIIYLPNDEYQMLNINTHTGDVEIKKIIFETVNINISTGDVKISNVTTRSLSIKGSTGDIILCNLDVSDDILLSNSTGDFKLEGILSSKLEMKTSIGDVKLTDVLVTNDLKISGSTSEVVLNSVDAENIYITLSTGDVRGTVLTDKNFITKSTTGKIVVPDTKNGGTCQITTTTGDIIISYKKN